MTKYIPLEEVKFILSHWEQLTYNANTHEEWMDIIFNRVDELPTIDPIAIINSEFLNRRDMDDYMYWWNDALQKIMYRLSLTQK